MKRTLPLIRDTSEVNGRVTYPPLSSVTLEALKQLGSLEEIFRLGELMGMRRAYFRQSVSPWTSEIYCSQYSDLLSNSVSYEPTRGREITDSIEAVVEELKTPKEKTATIDFSWSSGEMIFRQKGGRSNGFSLWETTNPVQDSFEDLEKLLELNIGPQVRDLPKDVRTGKFKASNPTELWDPQFFMEEVSILEGDRDTRKFFGRDVTKEQNVKFKSSITIGMTSDVVVFLKMALPDMFIG